MRPRHSTIPRRKVKRPRRGAALSVYLDFALLEDLRVFAEREGMNFNEAVREVLYHAMGSLRPRRNTRKP